MSTTKSVPTASTPIAPPVAPVKASQEAQPQIALVADQLSVHYDKMPVLWDLSFRIPTGKLVGIVGPNGAGKTTLIKAALGLVKPLSGRITFFGKSYAKMAHRIAYVPQRGSIDWDFPITVRDVVLMGRYRQLGLFRWVRRADRAAADRYLEKVGMADYANRQISQLSGGQQQRVFLARALMQEADLYLLDEPFAGIDVATEQIIMEILRTLRDRGKTVCVVHHALHSVPSYFDWAVLLNMRLIACGPIDQVFTKEALERTYGKGYLLLDEALKLSQSQMSGIR